MDKYYLKKFRTHHNHFNSYHYHGDRCDNCITNDCEGCSVSYMVHKMEFFKNESGNLKHRYIRIYEGDDLEEARNIYISNKIEVLHSKKERKRSSVNKISIEKSIDILSNKVNIRIRKYPQDAGTIIYYEDIKEIVELFQDDSIQWKEFGIRMYKEKLLIYKGEDFFSLDNYIYPKEEIGLFLELLKA